MVRRAGGKNLFTESDDDNLIEYIAKVKPNPAGRQGNKIYISLEESNRRWAERHPWQSWRERYRKNQDWFNHKIKKYQKKPRECPSETETEDREELYAELFGFSEDGEDESDVKKTLLAVDDVVKIETVPTPLPTQELNSLPYDDDDNDLQNYPLKQKVDHELAKEKELQSSKTLHPRVPLAIEPSTNNPLPKAKLQRTAPSQPFPSLNSLHYSLPAPTSTPGTDEERRATASKPAVSSGQKSSAAAAAIGLKPPRRIHPKLKRKVSRNDDIDFFGTPSPSPSLPAAKSTPRNGLPILIQGSYRNSLKRDRAAFDNVTNDKLWPPKRRKKMAKDNNVSPDVEMSDAGGRVEKNNAVFASLPAEGSANGQTRLRPPAQVNAVASSSTVLLPDPPHTTSPVRDFSLPPRRIDLRKSHDATRRRSHTSTDSRHSNLSFLLPEDREIFNQVGLPKVMAVIAKNYGFDVDVAMKAFFATKSIEKTKSLLQFAKDVTNSATSALLSGLLNGDDIDSSDDGVPQSLWLGHNSSPSGKDESTLNSGCQKAKRSRKSLRLSIKPRPFDEEIDEIAFSDYSPPYVSRAGQFLRLVKEGRREEAVDRERRRASGVFVVETQAQAQRYDHEVDDHLHRIFFKRISEGQTTLNEDEDDPEVTKMAQENRDLVMNVTEDDADALRSFEQKHNQDLLRLWSLDWMKQKIADM